MRFTRRQLAAALAGSAGAALAPAQQPPRQADASGAELESARERLRAAARALERREIPMATEPAFQFKP